MLAAQVKSMFDAGNPDAMRQKGIDNVAKIYGKASGIALTPHGQFGWMHNSADTLVMATGNRHTCFDYDEWEALAPDLKTLEDATTMRRKLLLAFEMAEREPDIAKRQALLTFAIIGAGPT